MSIISWPSRIPARQDRIGKKSVYLVIPSPLKNVVQDYGTVMFKT
jgi:hypothetical protein